MKKLLATCMSLLLAVTLVACGGTSRDTSLVRVGVGKDLELLDPAIVDDSVTANVLAQVYEGMYKLNSKGEVELALAKELPTISADGLTYTIKLRDDAKWSDGEPVTAKDFEWSMKRAVTTSGYYTQFIYQYVDGAGYFDAEENAYMPYTNMDDLANAKIKALDDTTLEITLRQKCPYFTSLLTNTVFYPVRKDYVEANSKDKDITKSNWSTNSDVPYNGAFKVDNVNLKDVAELSVNEHYYAKDEVKLEKIEFKVMPDMDTQTTAFDSGEIDFATSVNAETVKNSEALTEQLYLIDPFVCNYYVLINAGNENTNAVLKDVNVRKAMMYAVDREEMIKVLDREDTAYELHGMVPVGIPGADGDFREEADKAGEYAYYDLEKAKSYMEAAGYNENNRLKLTYSSNDNVMHKTVVQSLQSAFEKIYIDLEYQAMEGEAFFEARDEGDFEICRHAMTADFLDPMGYLSMNYGASTPGNTTDDAKFEALIDEANKLDGAARMNKLHEAEKYLVEEMAYVIPLFGYTDPHLKASDLKGITSSPEGHYNLTRAYYKE